MAQAIVYFRDVDDQSVVGERHPHGPFKSIVELNQVRNTAVGAPAGATFQNGNGVMSFLYTRGDDIDARQGDFTPNNPTAGTGYPLWDPTTPGVGPNDAVPSDFKEKFLALTRISN